jgi:hypothetical protein
MTDSPWAMQAGRARQTEEEQAAQRPHGGGPRHAVVERGHAALAINLQ